jgi:hypothetical protein
MSSPLADSVTTNAETKLRAAALDRIRLGVNPFANQVAAVGTAEECLLSGVPEFAENQLKDLLYLIGTYRSGRPTTRAFAVLGERGAGKTHLFYTLRDELKRQAGECGEETLLIVVDRLSPGMDAIDYLLWQIANHFLAYKGEGGRMLGVISGRVTARLLGESLRQLAPHQKAELIPRVGFWSKFGIGSTKTQAKIDAIDRVIQRCEGKHPTSEQLCAAIDEARVKPDSFLGVIERHLDRTESNDVAGWLRKELYNRLARIALLDDREPFEELHMGGFEDARANVKNAGNLGRRLLETWLELLTVLSIPVVVVFDQLEDYINAPDPEQEKISRKFFTDSTAKFINELRSVCLLIFANQTFWTQLINVAEPYAKERLTQPIPLPGEARASLSMPASVPTDIVERLGRRRILHQFPDLDLTGLSPTFPFDASDVKRFAAERSIRTCLRAMSKRYDEIVHKTKKKEDDLPPPSDLKKRLAKLWQEKMNAAKRLFETEISVGTAFIPEVQNALDGWLQFLYQQQMTGSGPWHRVELVTNTKLGAYGYLCVIRTEGRNAPGIGIAAWLGQSRGQSHDLKQRATFFKANPCPIKTLVLLRADLEATLRGPQTKDVYESVREKYDVRVQEFEPRHLHELLAFSSWQQAAIEELKTTKETDSNAETVFKDYLGELSKELLGWVDAWRQPRPLTLPVAVKGAKA